MATVGGNNVLLSVLLAVLSGGALHFLLEAFREIVCAFKSCLVCNFAYTQTCTRQQLDALRYSVPLKEYKRRGLFDLSKYSAAFTAANVRRICYIRQAYLRHIVVVNIVFQELYTLLVRKGYCRELFGLYAVIYQE